MRESLCLSHDESQLVVIEFIDWDVVYVYTTQRKLKSRTSSLLESYIFMICSASRSAINHFKKVAEKGNYCKV